MSIEIKPCPFCGSEVTLVERGNLLFFRCPDDSACIGGWLATSGTVEHREASIRTWNTRHGEVALRERVRLLSEGLDATSTHLMKMSAMLALSGDMEASDTVEGWADTARAILTEEAEMMRDDQEKISERLQ